MKDLYNTLWAKALWDRLAVAGMLDIKNELKVGEEFWDFLSGDGIYNDLLNCFERVGIELTNKIDDHFKKNIISNLTLFLMKFLYKY